MSEIIPPTGEPNKESPKPRPFQTEYDVPPLGKGACAGIGAALMVWSVVMAFIAPPLALLALVGAFLSLFFEGYRYIFIGYILTLLIVFGLFFLAIVVICGSGPHSM